jgi:hypothetical protein
MDMPKTPPQPLPLVEPAPPAGSPPAGSSLSESKAQPLNVPGVDRSGAYAGTVSIAKRRAFVRLLECA